MGLGEITLIGSPSSQKPQFLREQRATLRNDNQNETKARFEHESEGLHNLQTSTRTRSDSECYELGILDDVLQEKLKNKSRNYSEGMPRFTTKSLFFPQIIKFNKVRNSLNFCHIEAAAEKFLVGLRKDSVESTEWTQFVPFLRENTKWYRAVKTWLQSYTSEQTRIRQNLVGRNGMGGAAKLFCDGMLSETDYEYIVCVIGIVIVHKIIEAIDRDSPQNNLTTGLVHWIKYNIVSAMSSGVILWGDLRGNLRRIVNQGIDGMTRLVNEMPNYDFKHSCKQSYLTSTKEWDGTYKILEILRTHMLSFIDNCRWYSLQTSPPPDNQAV